MNKLRKVAKTLLAGAAMLLLGGCKLAILDPQGPIARQQMHLLIDAVLLMLVVVVPVTILVIIVTIKYRSSNKKAEYKPNWAHSNAIEAVCWTIPLIIIVILGTMTWISSHKLDPYRPIHVKGKQPLVIQAIALDWKWLFIYPKQHIAAINYMQIPVGTPVSLQITADAPMNSLEMPQLAGQIYAMGGMRTRLHFMADNPGVYKGLSTNYSGKGFVGMVFHVHAVSQKSYQSWVKAMQHAPEHLTLATYQQLAKPSSFNKVQLFSHVQDGVFHYAIQKYLVPKTQLDKMFNIKTSTTGEK